MRLTRRPQPAENGNVALTTGGICGCSKFFVQHPREPLTRDKLMNLARGRGNGAPWSAALMYRVARLRRLIEDDLLNARYIHRTVWGAYGFVPDGQNK